MENQILFRENFIFVKSHYHKMLYYFMQSNGNYIVPKLIFVLKKLNKLKNIVLIWEKLTENFFILRNRLIGRSLS